MMPLIDHEFLIFVNLIMNESKIIHFVNIYCNNKVMCKIICNLNFAEVSKSTCTMYNLCQYNAKIF